MSAQIISITAKLETVWQEYVTAAQKAQTTLDINDGIAAGKAYRRWLDLFLTDDQKAKLGALR